MLGSLAPLARPRAASLRSRPTQPSPAAPAAGRLASALLGLLRGLPTSLGIAKEVPRNYDDFN